MKCLKMKMLKYMCWLSAYLMMHFAAEQTKSNRITKCPLAMQCNAACRLPPPASRL